MASDKPFNPAEFLTKRTERSQAKLDVLVAFLNERLRLNHNTLKSLDQDSQSVRALLCSFRERRGQGRMEASGLESSLILQELGIERERRSQQLGLWNDLLRLVQQILPIWKGVEEARSKEDMLKGSLEVYKVSAQSGYLQKENESRTREKR